MRQRFAVISKLNASRYSASDAREKEAPTTTTTTTRLYIEKLRLRDRARQTGANCCGERRREEGKFARLERNGSVADHEVRVKLSRFSFRKIRIWPFCERDTSCSLREKSVQIRVKLEISSSEKKCIRNVRRNCEILSQYNLNL